MDRCESPLWTSDQNTGKTKPLFGSCRSDCAANVLKKDFVMDEKPIVSGVKHFAGDYTTMEYIFPACLIFGASIMFFFLLLAIFGNDKSPMDTAFTRMKMKKAKKS
ncbi:hypothetical protein TcWFU_002072 [Taenia crassiceps]|uniref:Uncharacterized protein n=1 Tax=Taenia crassiceps TaxID=6207 RepID=A0ABR4QPA2_9CEST